MINITHLKEYLPALNIKVPKKTKSIYLEFIVDEDLKGSYAIGFVEERVPLDATKATALTQLIALPRQTVEQRLGKKGAGEKET